MPQETTTPRPVGDEAIMKRIRFYMLAMRVGIVAVILVMMVLAWILLTQNSHLTYDEMQKIRGTIFVFGIFGLFAVAIGTRWTRTLEARARELGDKVAQVQQRSEQRLSTAMEFSSVPQVMTDNQGVILSANPAFAHLLARAPIELVGANLESLLGNLDVEKLVEVEAFDFQGETHRQYRQIIRATDMSSRIVRMADIPVPDTVEDTFSSLVQFEDLTDLVRHHRILADDNRLLEQRVEERTKALKAANAELESFAYSVSHDLRGPLRAIDGFGQVLKHTASAKLEPQELDYLDRITGATTRMGELIDALLKMSRLTTAPLNVEPIDLSEMIREIVLEVQMQYPGHNVEVDVQDGLKVRGDKALVRNLFTNLLGNSFKFTRETESPKVIVAGKSRNKFWIEIEVRDNGAGFNQKYAGKLFRPFQRLHRLDEFEGHGIGLASVKRIIDRHGGTLDAQGELGKGASIRVTLPSVPSV